MWVLHSNNSIFQNDKCWLHPLPIMITARDLHLDRTLYISTKLCWRFGCSERIGPWCPNSKCLVFIFPPACAALRPLIHIHATCTTPKWIMRREAPNWIMACVWKGVIMHTHVCAARVLNQTPWHYECGFYIIILNKPVPRLYKKMLTQWVALANETIIVCTFCNGKNRDCIRRRWKNKKTHSHKNKRTCKTKFSTWMQVSPNFQ